MINETLEYFKYKGVLVCELFCSPENSEPFWQKIGFEKFQFFPYDSKIKMFKPLIETLKPTENPKTEKVIALWNCEPYQADNINAIWFWNLDFLINGETLKKPIIFPAFKDWKVEFIVNDEILISNKVKRFPLDLANHGNFMIIRKIK